MEITNDSVGRLAARIRDILGEPGRGLRPISYPGSLALCLIDAIYSAGSHPTAVDNIIDRYTVRHGWADGAKSLGYSIAAAGGERAWAQTVSCNLKPANTHPGAPLKAEVVNRSTRLMADLDIDTVPDLLSAVAADPRENAVISGWRELPSQGSAVTYFHLLTLAGSTHFEIDRAVRRFLTDSIAEVVEPADDSLVSADDARDVVTEAAMLLALDRHEVERIVWQCAHWRIHPARSRPDESELTHAAL